jgi:hypothetical protein
MFRSILISSAGAIAFALSMALFARARTRETNPSGNPVLRYLAAPYLLMACALAFLAVGIYQWFVPLNHRYSGTLLILSYAPAAIGLFALGMSAYLFTFRATLNKATIEVSRWPIGTTRFSLSDLEAIESKGQNTVLHFSGNRKFVVYPTYSGHADFLSAVSANNSFKPKPLRGSAQFRR